MRGKRGGGDGGIGKGVMEDREGFPSIFHILPIARYHAHARAIVCGEDD